MYGIKIQPNLVVVCKMKNKLITKLF